MPYSKTIDKNRGFVFYRLVNRNTEEIKESIIDDISVKGITFSTPQPINPRAILECEIYRPIGYRKNVISSFFVLAKVVWMKEIDNSGEFGSNKYRVGLRFIKISARNREKIAK